MCSSCNPLGPQKTEAEYSSMLFVDKQRQIMGRLINSWRLIKLCIPIKVDNRYNMRDRGLEYARGTVYAHKIYSKDDGREFLHKMLLWMWSCKVHVMSHQLLPELVARIQGQPTQIHQVVSCLNQTFCWRWRLSSELSHDNYLLKSVVTLPSTMSALKGSQTGMVIEQCLTRAGGTHQC